ncbi:MAG TPA: hypothetical protein PLR65_14100 [Anaerolineales bacterium]|nr:hypothetical protein [Anaerolineales bacterium]
MTPYAISAWDACQLEGSELTLPSISVSRQLRVGQFRLEVEQRSYCTSPLLYIENKNLREKSAGLNREIISSRAEYGRNMQRAEGFYEHVYE